MSDFFLGKTQAREVDGRCHGRYHGRYRMRETPLYKGVSDKKGEVLPVSFLTCVTVNPNQATSDCVEVCSEQSGSLLGAKKEFAWSKIGSSKVIYCICYT